MKFHTISLLFFISLLNIGCTATPASLTVSVDNSQPVSNQAYLSPPDNDCEIRLWYNYQVIAIPVINQRWQENSIALKNRAIRAHTLRHNARINARYMMKSGAEVLRQRDLKKYGNPDGPTFDYLLSKIMKSGKSAPAAYRAIIDASSRTDQGYNQACE